MMKLQVLLCGIVPKIEEFLPSSFFHHSDENGVFSQFGWFEEKVFFIYWIWK